MQCMALGILRDRVIEWSHSLERHLFCLFSVENKISNFNCAVFDTCLLYFLG